MILKDIDLYNLPMWLNAFCDELESRCRKELKKESNFYNQVLNESGDLLEQYRFIATLSDDDIVEPIKLTVEEARALERFMRLESDQKDMEILQMYLLGLRHMFQLLQELKVL